MKTVKLTVIGMVLMGAIISGGTATVAAEEKTRDTKAYIKFKDSDGEVVDPVDPTNPVIPVIPVDPTEPGTPIKPGTKGPLSLDYASELFFDEVPMSSKDKEYFAKTITVTNKEGDAKKRQVPLYAQITDDRGTAAGWTLSVKQNGQFKTATKEELTGAEITFLNGQVDTISEALKPGFVKNTETALNSDTAQASTKVMAAKDGEASGTYVYRFGKDEAEGAKSVKLSVPGKTVKKKQAYTTTLTWTLSDTAHK
ncbi:WxL domain-containing protein [Carnobacterium maltaromaticum]|uniref:WxL domain-containing protein n=1 Tax=Carnobacterium maltaromaticum TaxID=2751 RepID=UPI0012F719D5|nr:WxL domain-containing protein [Carnobacterium maltaromaticum]